MGPARDTKATASAAIPTSPKNNHFAIKNTILYHKYSLFTFHRKTSVKLLHILIQMKTVIFIKYHFLLSKLHFLSYFLLSGLTLKIISVVRPDRQIFNHLIMGSHLSPGRRHSFIPSLGCKEGVIRNRSIQLRVQRLNSILL